MARGDFTYEVRTEDAPPVGIQDYVVRTRDGESAGTVGGLLQRGDERLLVVVVGGLPPFAGGQRVLPWHRVERVDHDAVAVWLTLDQAGFEREALELDREQAVEAGQGNAEARTIDEPPEDLIPAAQGAEIRGPVDRTIWLAVLATFLAASIGTLVATMAVFLGGSAWAPIFAVPALLTVVMGGLAYRAYRDPYERRAARKG